MAERAKHLFEFKATDIAKAAREESRYHTERLLFWQKELAEATEIVEKTAKVTVKRQEHTGGWSPVVAVDYGDPAAYQRMQQAAQKIQSHRAAADRFESDGTLYGTQGDRYYELDAEDVAHFRLNGRERES